MLSSGVYPQRRSLSFYFKGIIYEVECRNDRLTAICIQYNDTESALIINVYMPCDTRRYDDSYGVYMDIVDEVEIIVQRMQPTHMIFGGYFNTDLKEIGTINAISA